MKIKKIDYLLPPVDPLNDCLDVYVDLEDGSSYFVEVTTPQFLSASMGKPFFSDYVGKFQDDYLEPGYPYIIVSKLTDEIIEALSKHILI
jgi:hypothetical protein